MNVLVRDSNYCSVGVVIDLASLLQLHHQFVLWEYPNMLTLQLQLYFNGSKYSAVLSAGNS